tara:strand:+ start:5496 stop:6497 length:1002 start_codon:yes stop_codon:yes gene_type:complete
MKKDLGKIYWFIILLCVNLGIILTILYTYMVSIKFLDFRIELHSEIINNEASSPYNFRILVPYLNEFFIKLFSPFFDFTYKQFFVFSYAFFDFLFYTLFLILLYIFLKIWHKHIYAIIGLLFCSVTITTTFFYHYFQPWSIVESSFFILAFILVYNKRFYWLIPLTIFSSLNRVTGIFIPIIFLITQLDFKSLLKLSFGSFDNKILMKTSFLFLISFLTIILVRYLRGNVSHVYTIFEIFKLNIEIQNIIIAFVFNILFAGIWWLLAFKGLKIMDEFHLRLSVVFIIYLIPLLIFGIWKEVRLLMPFYPLVISLGLFYLSHTFKFEEKTGYNY